MPGEAARDRSRAASRGMGFKFAPTVGEVLADLVERGTTRHEIGYVPRAGVSRRILLDQRIELRTGGPGG